MSTTPSLDDVRAEVAAWLDDHWDESRSVGDWWELTTDAGWQFPNWPEGMGGRGLSGPAVRAVAEQFVKKGALGPPAGLGQVMGAPVVLEHGNADQQRAWVRRLAAGQESWCQFFSEPEAGSDLAGLRSTAMRDGDEWIVNGQKVWTSGAVTADRGMLVCRTDWDVPKHRGLSYFIIDLDQPGVEVRPLTQMNRHAHFNEVFFTDARVPHENLIGGEGDGWAAAVTTLAFERSGLSLRAPGLTTAHPGEKNRMLTMSVRDALAGGADSGNARNMWGGPGAMRRLAIEYGVAGDTDLRQEIMAAKSLSDAIGWTGQRAKAAASSGKRPGVEANLAKLARAELGRAAQSMGPRILGPAGMLDGTDAPKDGGVTEMVLSVPAGSIAGGSDEIQRNIIAERGLGLPKDVATDRDIPFKDVPKSGAAG